MSQQQFVSWNVNGIRAIIKKGFQDAVKEMNPSVLCLQETKADADEARETLEALKGYNIFVNSSKARKGYSGTAIITLSRAISDTLCSRARSLGKTSSPTAARSEAQDTGLLELRRSTW